MQTLLSPVVFLSLQKARLHDLIPIKGCCSFCLWCSRQNLLVYDFDVNIMAYCLEKYLEHVFKMFGKVCVADFLQELQWLCCCSVLCFVSVCSCSLPKNTHLLFLFMM